MDRRLARDARAVPGASVPECTPRAFGRAFAFIVENTEGEMVATTLVVADAAGRQAKLLRVNRRRWAVRCGRYRVPPRGLPCASVLRVAIDARQWPIDTPSSWAAFANGLENDAAAVQSAIRPAQAAASAGSLAT